MAYEKNKFRCADIRTPSAIVMKNHQSRVPTSVPFLNMLEVQIYEKQGNRNATKVNSVKKSFVVIASQSYHILYTYLYFCGNERNESAHNLTV